MLGYILRRLAATVPVMLIVAVLVFLMLRLTPGDPAAIIAGDNATSQDVADIRAHLGRWVAVGPGATVGPDSEVDDSVLHTGAVVSGGARVVGSVIGSRARVGPGAILSGCVLGEGSSVAGGVELDGERVPAGTDVLRA